MSGALEGIRVADFSRVLAGPYATMLLGDLGADVVKIEHPESGDETRSWGPPWHGGEATYFLGVNRNKRSRTIDLSTPDGRDAAWDEIAHADVVVQNFRPGTMERFGLGPDEVLARLPRSVYCSMSGFGAGRGADLPGYDLIVQAAGGLMSITGLDEDSPVKTGVALVDVITGLHAVTGILAALRHRDEAGIGQHVEVNLFSSLLSALANQASSYVSTGNAPRAMGNQHPSIAPYETMQTADRPLAIAAANDKLFAELTQVLHRPDLLQDSRFSTNSQRVLHRHELVKQLEETLTAQSADYWFSALRAAGVPCSPINGLAEAFVLAENLQLDAVTTVSCPERGTSYPQVANPIGLSATPATYRLAPPAHPA